MTKLIQSRWILAAAVAAVPFFAVVGDASAQYRVDTSGVNDANNRVGSGGRNPNDSGQRTGGMVTGNDVITGNVTGGKEFRGHVPYRNTQDFRSRTGGENLDNFVRSSSSVDARLAEDVKPFYGVSQTAVMPKGYQQTAIGSGAYVPAPVGPQTPRPVGDPRMGAIDLTQPNLALPNPGELLLPGPVDPTAGQQYITASPLLGIRPMGTDAGFIGTMSNTEYNPATGRLTPQQIQRIQDEMNEGFETAPGSALPKAPGALPPPMTTDDKTGATVAGGTATGIGSGARAGAGGAAGAGPVVQQPITTGGPGATPFVQQPIDTSVVASGLGTNQGVRQRIIIPPQQQSSLYAELLKRAEETAADPNATDAEAAQAYNAARAQGVKQAAGAPGQPPAGAPGAVPPGAPGGLPGQPGATAQQPGVVGPRGVGPAGAVPVPPPPGASAQEPTGAGVGGVTDFAKRNEEILKRDPGEQLKRTTKRPTPMKVPSLGQGIKSKDLTAIMKNAETNMKEGKFTAALDQYDQAEQVVPNNPLVKLGRANAELGASYYARADAHLREVFTKNPELLVGQYDLNAWLGEQRLQQLVKDLKEIASKDQKESRPVFLLAYISYNTGNEQQADAYLDLADKRGGGADPFYKLLRDNWALPEKAPAPGNAAPTPEPASTPPPAPNK